MLTEAPGIRFDEVVNDVEPGGASEDVLANDVMDGNRRGVFPSVDMMEQGFAHHRTMQWSKRLCHG
jgi:hypothetical protein